MSPRRSSSADGSVRKPATYAREEVVEPGSHVGHAEHRVVGDLVDADPQPEVVGAQAPLLAELVEVRHDEQQLVGDGP